MSTTEGKIFSNAGIVAVIEEYCPPAAQAKPGEIAEMVGRLLDPNVRINPRGCRSIGWPPTYIPPQETDAAADLQEDLILHTGTPWRNSGSRRLIHYRGEFCVWNGTHYEQISGRALKAEITVVEREPVETPADLTEEDRDPYLVAEAKARSQVHCPQP